MADARPILIAGPTASGKSGLALGLAERLGGVVINADSMQVYSELRILAAMDGARVALFRWPPPRGSFKVSLAAGSWRYGAC